MSPHAGSQDARPAIAILQTGEALGDALLHLTAYRGLRLALPDHRIVALYRKDTVFSTSLSLIRPLVIDEVRRRQPIAADGRALVNALRPLGTIDLILDFRSNLRPFWSWLALRRQVPRFASNSVGYLLRAGIPGVAERRPRSNVERFHRLVELAVGRQLPFDCWLPTLPQARARVAELLPPGERYFGIATGMVNFWKSWPRENFIPLAAALRALGLRIVFLLGTAESDQREWFERHFPDAIVIDQAAAGGDPQDLLWLIHATAERLTGCVANEGGLGHLVATQCIPLLTLAGPTNPHRWQPVTPFWWLVRAQNFGSSRMADIPVAPVISTVVEMVQWAEQTGGDELARLREQHRAARNYTSAVTRRRVVLAASTSRP